MRTGISIWLTWQAARAETVAIDSDASSSAENTRRNERLPRPKPLAAGRQIRSFRCFKGHIRIV
jgi:hypothetical protein